MYDYLGSSAYTLVKQALEKVDLTRVELDTLSKILVSALDSICVFFTKELEEKPPKPLSGIPAGAHEEIETTLAKTGDSNDWALVKQDGFIGLYLLKNSAFFPVAPEAIITRISVSYQSDYSKVSTSISLFGNENGTYTLTEALLPKLTLLACVPPF